MRSGKWELADDISGRHRQSKANKEQARGRQELWGLNMGRYAGYPVLSTDHDLRYKDKEGLQAVERWLKHRAVQVLEAKRAAGDPSPVIMVDFGGMYGLSFCQIARALERESQLISKGDIVLVVTNLGFDPLQNLKELVEQEHTTDLFPDLYFSLIMEVVTKGLVHYIRSDAAELRKQSVQLTNGQTIQLHRNIDIIHEYWALVHSSKNDVDLPLIARSLSEYGTLFLGSNLSGEVFTKGLENLRKENMEPQYFGGQSSMYILYKKTRSPAIEPPKNS